MELLTWDGTRECWWEGAASFRTGLFLFTVFIHWVHTSPSPDVPEQSVPHSLLVLLPDVGYKIF